MTNKMTQSRLKTASGFTLIELLVVILIIGILAAIAVPQYFKVVERGKFTESMQWIGGLTSAQERYLNRTGFYFSGSVYPGGGTSTSPPFDVNLGVLTKFTATNINVTSVSGAPVWSVTLVRNSVGGNCPNVYGCYTLVYAAPPGTFTCNTKLAGDNSDPCALDLLPQ